MQHFTDVFTNLVHQFGYVGLFFVMIAGNVGLPAGTEIVVPFAGALAGEGHLVPPSWVLVGAVATAGEFVGAVILYTVGYYGGEAFVHRYGKYVRIHQAELDRMHAFYGRYGKNTVFFSRFIPFVRGVASLPAGISRMPKRWFFTYSTAGSAVFCFGLAYLGNAAGTHIDIITPYLHRFSLAIVAILVVAVVAFVWYRTAKKSTKVA